MKQILIYTGFILCIISIFFLPSCVHDPILGEQGDMDPSDTIVMDTMPGDTSGMDDENPMDTTTTLKACDPDTVYFQKDILPLIVSNCALSGCHDAATASDGVILNTYTNIIVTGEIKPFDLEDSELYEKITEDDPDDVMPPSGKLPNAQIELIARWILQGALDNDCDENDSSGCITTGISFSNDILKIFEGSCIGCHTTAVKSGGVILDTYQGVKSVADNGKLYGSIAHLPGFAKMPQGLPKLDDCTISQIKAWIDEGAPDN